MDELKIFLALLGAAGVVGLPLWLVKWNLGKVSCLEKEKADKKDMELAFQKLDVLESTSAKRSDLQMYVTKDVCGEVQRGNIALIDKIENLHVQADKRNSEDHKQLVGMVEKMNDSLVASNQKMAEALADFQKCLINIANKQKC